MIGPAVLSLLFALTCYVYRQTIKEHRECRMKVVYVREKGTEVKWR